MSTQYKGIGFDYGGVLKGQPSVVFLDAICELLGITYHEYQMAYYRHNRPLNRGEISWDMLWTLFLDDIGQPERLQEVLELFRSSEPTELNEKLLLLVDRLRDRGYKVGLLSNNTHQAAEKMRHEGLAAHFDVMHISAETGFVKPENESFIYLAQKMGVKISELVFVDDSNKSLSTAADIGYHPIHYTSYSNLTKQLEQLGILD